MTTLKFDAAKVQFEKFLSSIGSISTSANEVNIIRNKLRRHFNTTTSDYLCSSDFLSALSHIQSVFAENKKSTKYFTLLASFDEQLKKHSIKLASATSLSPTSSSISTSVVTDSPSEPIENTPVPQTTEPTIEYESSIAAVQETIEHLLDQCDHTEPESHASEALPTSSVTSSSIETLRESKQQRKVVKLERRLSRLSRIIRDLEEKDMSLEEMAHCDLYVVESNLKKRACELHTKLAQLKSQSSSIERIIHQPITLDGSNADHPLINQELEVMVNQSKHFPSFSDVLNTVEKANDTYKLRLDEESRRKLAEKSFKTIGKQIKDRRMADFHDIMNSRLPEDFNIEQSDPALDNAEMTQVLMDNEREANMKTEKIFEEFSQIEPDAAAEINIESSDVEATHESEEQHQSDVAEEPPAVQSDQMDITPASSPEPPIPTTSEPTPEISLSDRRLKILSTASLPVRRAAYDRNSETDVRAEPSSSRTSSGSDVQTLIPRRKSNLTDNEIIYSLYRQRLTTNTSAAQNDVPRKRRVERTNEYVNVKTPKRPAPELIVLD